MSVGKGLGYTLRFPLDLYLHVVTVGAEGEVIHDERIVSCSMRERSLPVAVSCIPDLCYNGGHFPYNFVILQRSFHGDTWLHESSRPSQKLIAVALEKRVAVYAKFEDSKRVVGIARGTIEPIYQDEITRCIRCATEAAEQEGFSKFETAVSRSPHRLRKIIDTPFVHEIFGSLWCEMFFRPERLSQSEHLYVHIGTLAIVDIPAVLHEIGGFVKITNGCRTQRPIRPPTGDEHLLPSQKHLQYTVLYRCMVPREQQIGQDRSNAGIVPEEIVALAAHPGMFV